MLDVFVLGVSVCWKGQWYIWGAYHYSGSYTRRSTDICLGTSIICKNKNVFYSTEQGNFKVPGAAITDHVLVKRYGMKLSY